MYNQGKDNSKSFVRAKTPNLGHIDDMASRSSFTKSEKPSRMPRDRKSIRNKKKENNYESGKVASPKRRSGKKPFKASRSPHDPSSEKKMHSPFFYNSNEKKKAKKVRIKQPNFGHDDEEEEEEPRAHVHFHQPNKENINCNTSHNQLKSTLWLMF